MSLQIIMDNRFRTTKRCSSEAKGTRTAAIGKCNDTRRLLTARRDVEASDVDATRSRARRALRMIQRTVVRLRSFNAFAIAFRGSRPTVRRTRAMSSRTDGVEFGPFAIPRTQIFYETANVFAIVNLKPVVRGHVLVCPKRVVPKFTDLTSEEIAELWTSVAVVQRVVERACDTSSSTLAIQDGPLAGQSVPHVHVHVLPRTRGDFARNDDVYDALEGKASASAKMDNDNRKPRSSEEMAIEAEYFRTLF